jgi:branched-chain amino acid transport system ATP-binding protein
MTMLSVRNLRANYGRIPVLHGIDFAVEAGEFVGILGHNGMGKSTLLKTILGQLRATDGEIAFEGRDITREPTHVRASLGIGCVPQGREIFAKLSVEENLKMGLLRLKAETAEQRLALDRVLEEFPRLKPLLGRSGGVLSGGEQQILAIARSLCGDPRLLMLDEPTEGIQPSIVEEILEILRKLRVSRGLTIVLVEQKLDFIGALVDRTFVIQRGLITGRIPTEGLADSAVVREFVGFTRS